MKREIITSSAFIRAVKRLKKDPAAFGAIRSTLTILQEDAFDPRLASHKLKGDLAGHWSCSAGYNLRIVFKILKKDGQEVVLLVSAGTHDQDY